MQDPPLSSDRLVYCLYLVCLVQLLLDLMLRSPFERNYFLGFYFWLDVSVFSVTCSCECLFCDMETLPSTSQRVAL